MKSPIFPADGSSPCVVIPSIQYLAVSDSGYKGSGGPSIMIGQSGQPGHFLKYPSKQSRDEAYNRLIEAIKEWYE